MEEAKITPRRSREGAWIEMRNLYRYPVNLPVAPARERGLKSITAPATHKSERRSREGAWIEIKQNAKLQAEVEVAPARERGLKSLLY